MISAADIAEMKEYRLGGARMTAQHFQVVAMIIA